MGGSAVLGSGVVGARRDGKGGGGGPVGVLVMAYGGPDSLDDIEPYLMDVRGGRAVSPELVAEMRERYRIIGGRSPILERTQAQSDRLQQALDVSNNGTSFRCFVGMRHWTPRIGTALKAMSQAGISRAIGVVMAPHYSRMSIGAYFAKATEANSPVEVLPIERWHLLPELIDALADRVVSTLSQFATDIRNDVQLIFTAHSLPERILEWGDPYPDELQATVGAVVERLRGRADAVTNRHEFAYQSAATTNEPWLGPDAGEVITRLHNEGRPGALVVPVGFTSDHVEILYDIDVEYARLAQRLPFKLERIPMLNDEPRTMAGIAGLVRQLARNHDWHE